MRARSSRWAVAAAALLLAPGPARAADVAVLAWTQTKAATTRTMRIPGNGSFTMPAVSSGYLVAAVAMTNTIYQVDSVSWNLTDPFSGRVLQAQAFHASSWKEVTDPDSCRTELWGLANPGAGPGFATVTVTATASTSSVPSLAGSLLAFANVASTSTSGPCCVNATNSGNGTSVINKTMNDTSRGDALVNAVCTSWNGGAVAGMPGPDPANDPEMVPRTFQVIENMQHFTGTSPGGEADAPATSYRHLRWLQTGTRVWAIAGLSLHATPTALLLPDAAAPPPDAAVAPPDAASAPADKPPVIADAASPLAPDVATPLPDAALATDSGLSPGPDVNDRPPMVPSRDIEAGPFEPQADASPIQRQVSLQVGCACRLGGTGGGAGVALALLALLLVRRRDASRRRLP